MFLLLQAFALDPHNNFNSTWVTIRILLGETQHYICVHVHTHAHAHATTLPVEDPRGGRLGIRKFEVEVEFEFEFDFDFDFEFEF